MSTPETETEFISVMGSAEAEVPAPKISTRELPEQLPILGLSDIVIFPGMVAPLLVESPGSVKLIDDVVGGNRLVGLVLQRKPEVENPKPDEMYEYGCAARVLKMLKFPDNTIRVLVEGLWRIHITGYDAQDPYLMARFELHRDVKEETPEMSALTRNAMNLFEEVVRLSPALSDQLKATALTVEKPGRLSDIISANLNLNLTEKQKLLETDPVKERLKMLLPLLNRELEYLNLNSKIQSDVANSISKTQRDFFLREQLRAIQRELGEADHANPEIKSLHELIEKTEMPPEAKKVAVQEWDRLAQMPTAMAEYGVARHYLDWLINLPWCKETEDKINLSKALHILNEQHFGLYKVKDRLLEFLAVIKLRKKLKGPILCLVGPPGVGKTSLGKSVADALGRKFTRISLGGMRDEAEIRGHRRTYVGALPGRILQSLRRVESRNPVILLDELDKVGTDFHGDPASALLEVLDPSQNSTFTDHYLDLPFDLSRVLFITTANWLDPVHPALRDRLEVIEIPSYTESEKVQIAKRHLIPRQLEEHGLTKSQVAFPDSTLRRLVRDYTREAGVRQLDRDIAALMRKAARRIAGQQQQKGLRIASGELEGFLGSPRFVSDGAEKVTTAGIAIGLAWTPVGGEILFIEATRMSGKGNLILTGSLGDVMKESAQTALSYLRSQAGKLGINLSDHARHDLHIHVPAGATPKDGPSAGITIVVALASLLTGRLVRSDIAMTGEISLRGRVLRVGGIKEKVLAAERFGLKEVILPEGNRGDWQEVPAEVRKKMKAHFVSHISEPIKLALRPGR